jgi:Ca2+-binding EF-hand superfamily protein
MKSISLKLAVIGAALALIFLDMHFAKAQAAKATSGTQSKIQSGAQSKTGTNQKLPTSGYRADEISRYSGISVDWTDFQRALDADRDGYVTKEEWDRAFVDHDVNGDGRLSVEELQAFFPKSGSRILTDAERQEAFERLDKNQSGVIERSEWPGNDMSFSRMDANHDGVISREEFLARNVRWWNLTFEELDFNGNGFITRAEWLDSDASFDRLDHNHDGVIEKSEFYNPR